MSKFEVFTENSIQCTRKNWEAIAGDEIFVAEYLRLFDNVSSKLGNERNSHESIYYGLFENNDDHASAIIEIVVSPKSKGTMTKLLNIDLSPKFLEVVNFRHEIIDIYTDLISKSLKLSKNVEKGYQLKIYGRTEEFRSVLLSVHSRLAVSKPRVVKKSDIDGRWLVIEHN
jgi:hypothetical protein